MKENIDQQLMLAVGKSDLEGFECALWKSILKQFHTADQSITTQWLNLDNAVHEPLWNTLFGHFLIDALSDPS